MGSPNGVASAAAVQIDSNGCHRALVMALGPGDPRSAVSGEMMAFALPSEGLRRGFEDDGSGTVDVYIDCRAFIAARAKPGYFKSEKFLFAGWCSSLSRQDVRERLGTVRKVAAHKARIDAEAQGWLDA